MSIVCQRKKQRSMFTKFLELKCFPWDSQDLSLQFVSDIEACDTAIAAEKSHLILNESKEWRSFAPLKREFLLREEYEIFRSVLGFESLTPVHASSRGYRYPILDVSIKVRRKARFYWTNVTEPLLISVCLCIASFFVHPSDLGTRLDITLTMLLTTAAYKQYSDSLIPNVSYDTALDLIIRCSLWVIAALSFLHCLSHLIFKSCADEPDLPSPTTCLWVLLDQPDHTSSWCSWSTLGGLLHGQLPSPVEGQTRIVSFFLDLPLPDVVGISAVSCAFLAIIIAYATVGCERTNTIVIKWICEGNMPFYTGLERKHGVLYGKGPVSCPRRFSDKKYTVSGRAY